MSIKYKIRSAGDVEDILHVESKISIPKDPDNRHYQEFLQDVKKEGLTIVEGPDVVTPDYKSQRMSEYPSIEDQLDKIYHTSLTAWKSEIKAIKDKYPKTNSGSTAVGSVPSWIQEESDKLPSVSYTHLTLPTILLV